MGINVINEDLMNELNALGIGADVDKLELYVATCQDAAALGNPIVTDTMYDQAVRLLKKLKPDSEVLNRNWEITDNDYDENDNILAEYGMRSILTIQNMSDLSVFRNAMGENTVDLFCSIKLNGHAVRAVYKYGVLVSGSTRGRYKKGRDITRHLKATLPNVVDSWRNLELVEVRGEMLVSLRNFEVLKNILKTPLSAVTSLVRDSVTDAELQLLDCVCYKCIVKDSNIESDALFTTLEDEFKHLKECGFKIPNNGKLEGVNEYNLDEAIDTILKYFESISDNDEIGYSSDGIVVAINDLSTFYASGMNGNAFAGNFALKMGRLWESNVYSSIVESIEWEHGKKYITPKAKVKPVITVTGAEVTNVPLYNVGVIENYGLTPGNRIFFKFGGETGVTLVEEDGSPINSDF